MIVSYPKDVLKMSVSVKKCRNANDEWINIVNINKAILELDHRGKGPVHINMMASLNTGFNQKELPKVRKISRYTYINDFPYLPKGRIAIFIGAHSCFNNEHTAIIDEFCSLYDAVVFCDNTSGYRGKYRVNHFLVAGQQQYESELLKMDLLIHLGEVSGATYITNRLSPRSVWRVSPDGEIRDTFKKLTCVFEMEETYFFSKYIVSGGDLLTIPQEMKINKFLHEHGAKVNIAKGYGMTESVAATCYTFPGTNEPGSIGIPMVGNTYKICDPETAEELEIGQEGEICVNDISSKIGMTKSAVSHQLSYLKNLRMVKSRKEGKEVFYSLDDDHVSLMVKSAWEHVNE